MPDFKLFGGTVHTALVHAATQYNIKQSRGKHYNHYALAQYLMRIAEVEADIATGVTPRKALIAAFSGSLLDCLLKAIGETKFDASESVNNGVFYRPISQQ